MSEIDPCYSLTAIRAPDDPIVSGLGKFFEQLETITEITDHAIKFKVEKYRRGKPNRADITLYNCAPSTRDDFVQIPQKIRFAAGYDSTPRLLFIGDLRYASNEKTPTEWLTKLEIGDGARAYASARVNKSYTPGTPVATIVQDIARGFGIQIELPRELKGRIAAGDLVYGDAGDEMTRVLAQFGLEWSFQNEQLRIIPVDAAVPGTIRVISQGDGMLESPVMTPPRFKTPHKAVHHRRSTSHSTAIPNVAKLKVKHTLYPELVPGEVIQLQSRSINGNFVIEVLQHEGDLFGNDWTTTIEAIAA